MRRFLLHWLVNALVLVAVANIVPGIHIASWGALIIAALVLGLLNAFLRPLLLVITLPLNILSLGIFTFFINAFLFYLVALLVRGFTVEGFWSAFLGSLLFGILSFLLHLVLRPFEGNGGPRRRPRNPRYPGAIDIEQVRREEGGRERRKR